MKHKICLLDVTASHYREDIFQLMNQTFDINFFFGDMMPSIKTFDLTKLSGFKKILPVKQRFGLYWYQGQIALLNKDYTDYIIDGDFRCISSWIMALKAKFKKNKNVYVWSHAWYGKENRIKKVVKKCFFKLLKGVFVYGDYAKNLMIENGISPNKLHIIHNSLFYEKQLGMRDNLRVTNIYTDHFHNENPTIIFIGRLTEVKRLDLLIKAIFNLNKRGIFLNLVLVGEGIEKNKLKYLCNEYSLENQTWFYGSCYEESTNSELLFNADLCVSPGNVGLTAIHALSYGVPVITHDNFPWQMPEFECIVPNKTGNFFKYGDESSLTDVIYEWLRTHRDRNKTREMCYQVIDDSWNPNFQINVLRSVILEKE